VQRVSCEDPDDAFINAGATFAPEQDSRKEKKNHCGSDVNGGHFYHLTVARKPKVASMIDIDSMTMSALMPE